MLLWIKALHVLFVIAWLVGIFYLPRIFVHYVEGSTQGEDVRRLVLMARRLLSFMSMMAVLAVALGLWMWLGFHDDGLWLKVKLVFVAGLIGYHLFYRMLLGRLLQEGKLPSALTLRLFNEGSLLLVVPIILLAVVKPF